MAGIAAGYAMSIVCTAAFIFLAVRSRDGRVLARLMPEGMSPVIAAVPASLGLALAWVFFGTLLGAGFALWGPEESRGPLPSVPYAVGILGVAIAPVPFLLIFWPRRWWLWVVMAGAFAALFGLALPVLATR